MNWYRSLGKTERKAFWACFGGWSLDAMDVQLYALALPALIAVWGLSKDEAGMLATVALLASSVGGIIAGYLADRIGRVRVLQISILWFSLFTFLSGLTQNYEQMLVARILQGIGFGGEWAAGAVLIAELVDPKHRGKTVAAVSSGWAVGYGAAALLATLIFNVFDQEIAWRILFFLGILPAGLVLFIRRLVSDSPLYLESKAAREGMKKTSLLDIFRGKVGFRTTVGGLVALGVLGGNYTVLAWLPTYLRTERGLSYSNTGLFLMVNIAGSFAGYILGGYASDWLGRKNALKLFAVLAVVCVVAYLGLGSSSLAVLLLGFPLGFCQSAMNAGVGPLLSELFPTHLRATGQGFTYNTGRGIGSFFPLLVGVISAGFGLAGAITIAASVAYALVFIVAFFLPQTTGRSLAVDA